MLYTIAEISSLINISKVNVYRKIKVKELQTHISKKQGVTYIDEEGLTLIKHTLKGSTNKSKSVNSASNNISLDDDIAIDTDNLNIKNDYIELLKQQLKIKDLQLKEQLTVKDLQISNLNERLKQEQELNKNSQILQLKQQPQENIKLLETHFEELDSKLEEVKSKMLDRKTQEKQKSFFGKMFKNND